MAKKLSRRDFLKLSGSSSLMVLLSQSNIGKALALGTQEEATISSVHLNAFNPNDMLAAEAVKETFRAATDLSWLNEGDTVFVKVASNSPYNPPAVTSPAAVTGVVELLLEAGAGTVYVGDMSGAIYVRHLAEDGFGSTRESMRSNGILMAAEDAGAEIHCFEEVPFEEAYVAGIPSIAHNWGEELEVAKILDEVDHIINLPRLGKHVLAGATLGLKNAVGWISDYSRMVLHRDASTFHEKIAEINAIPQIADKTRLTLTLADIVLTTDGPDSGYRLSLNPVLIIASEDVVSHDQVALLTLLWARRQLSQEALSSDLYPAGSSGSNKWFVQSVWHESAEDLPVFDDLAEANALTHINYAYEILNGGRPDLIEVVPAGIELDNLLATMLTERPELNIMIREIETQA
jgi:uncharacterized protein (DUF362 family)